MAEITRQKTEYASESVFRKRIRKFKSLKRGYYSFVFIVSAYILSFFCPLLMNYKALVVKYNDAYYFPIAKFYPGNTFGLDIYGEVDYRELKQEFKTQGRGNWVLMPFYPYGPYESLTDPREEPPNQPSREHWFGTDDRGRDVFVRLTYGFNISLSFAILVVIVGYIVGVSIGASLGYFGGKFDILSQRLIEIWAAIPFLYMIIIVSSIIHPNFTLLVILLCLFSWMGMTYFIRGEFYREKAKDYVHAAIAMGASDRVVVFKHILPNSLTPVITFFPFAIVGGILSLVALDYLGFGLPPPTASWGELLNQGRANIFSWWLVFFPLGALFMTLQLVVFFGEAVRQAFDPREHSRLR